jgi:hypothetical protein
MGLELEFADIRLDSWISTTWYLLVELFPVMFIEYSLLEDY